MIELRCEDRGRSKAGWTQLAAVIPPSEVEHWCHRFHADDAIFAMWQLATEVIEATEGRKHWVGHIGNAMQLSWEVRGALRKRVVTIPTPEGPEGVWLIPCAGTA